MSIEIEKKYRLTTTQRAALLLRLPQMGAIPEGEEFEENTLYIGGALEVGRRVLRLRRLRGEAILTYKERLPSSSSVKRQREEETRVSDPDAMDAILDALGFSPALVYEKRRETWKLGNVEVVIDELPFGLFMEIEGPEDEIRSVERRLALKGLRAELETYPLLTRRHGKVYKGVIEARFPRGKATGQSNQPTRSRKKSGPAH